MNEGPKKDWEEGRHFLIFTAKTVKNCQKSQHGNMVKGWIAKKKTEKEKQNERKKERK